MRRRMVNSAGSLALAEHRPKRDAFLVERLRAAGAVILGKTNLSEWANFRSHAFDLRLERARRADAKSLRAGSQSLRLQFRHRAARSRPASPRSASAPKPTAASSARPRSPAWSASSRPSAWSAAAASSRSRQSRTPPGRWRARRRCRGRCCRRWRASTTAMPRPRKISGHVPTDYLPHLKPMRCKGARIGVLRKLMGYQPDVDAAIEARHRSDEGSRRRRSSMRRSPPGASGTTPNWRCCCTNSRHGLNSTWPPAMHRSGSLAALIEFNKQHAAHEMPWFGQELFEQAQAKGPADRARPTCRRATRHVASPARRGIEAVIEKQHLDALVAPSMSPAWLTDPINGDHFTGAGYGAAAVAGTPASPCRWATAMACRWASCSWARRGAKRG